MLNLDLSILVITFLVWLLMNILNRIYYRPVGKILQEREKKVEKDSQELESMNRQIAEKTQSIEKILADSKSEAYRMHEELIRKGETICQEIIGESREKSRILFESSIRELDKEINRAEEKLVRDI